MKTLSVKKISFPATESAAQIPSIFDAEQIPFQQINCVNWKDYPYMPEAKFRIAHTGDAVLIHYCITEKSVRAVAPADNGRVWEDSCAEFFVQPTDENKYYNFECNCAGTLLIEYGIPGNREHAPLETVGQVARWASLGRRPFEERMGECTWQLALRIPVSAFFHDKIALLDGKKMRANFYKCGDKLQTPHFLSWNPIALPSPCFHCPDFFGEIIFESK
ncbi:uncharacterized protein BN461_01189 [Bacteroides sp. CAG:1076]|jgi:hypothetical protein|nr:uncharacterized protein BN461_01189 [Bacteroides sp. CAG:1076]